MSKKLEEAIYLCKQLVNDYKEVSVFTIQAGNRMITSIETVLQALENSISKDTIKEKIQELKERRKLYDENNYKDIEMINTLSNIIITLENLLNNN